MNGWGLSFLRARAILTLIASLMLSGAFPVAADSGADLVKALASTQRQVRMDAQEQLIKAGPAAIDNLVAGMDNRKIRTGCLRIIGGFGPKAVPRLFELLDDPVARSNASEALFQDVGPSSWALAPKLLSCAMEKPAVKQYCGMTMVKVAGPKNKAMAPALIEMLKKNKDPDMRGIAAGALGQIGVGAVGAVPALAGALKDKEVRVRWSAATSLAKFGPSAKSAVPALTAALNDPDGDVRNLAGKALKKIKK